MPFSEQLLSSIKHIFKAVKTTGDGALSQVGDQEINVPFAGNSIATIVRHLNGNMLSRWRDMFTTDGEKLWRNRDAEFEHVVLSHLQVSALWEEGWATVFKALEILSDADIDRSIIIRGQNHTLCEALHRHLQHYSYHVGQIVLLAKGARASEWSYLSIAPGQSKDYKPQGKSGEPPVRLP